MAMSPVSGAISPTQLAVLEQIRALRAAKPPVPTAAPTPAAAPVRTAPLAAAASPAPTAATALDRPQPNRPRGSILNITV